MNALTGEGSMNGFAPPGLSVNGGLHGGQNSLSPNSESPMGISSQERFLGQPQMAGGCLVMPSGQRMFSVQAQQFAYSNRAFVTQQQQASPFTTSASAQPFFSPSPVANGQQFVMVQGFPTSHPGAAIAMIPQQPAEPPSSPQFNASSTVAATDTTDNCEISEVNSGDFMSMANGNNDYSRDDGMSANDARAATLDTKWYYIGQDCKTYGPKSASVMAEWYRARYFPENVLLRTENDESFYKLSEWISNCGNQIPFTKNIISMNALTGEGSMNGFAPPGLSVNGGLHGGQNSLGPNSESPMGISSQERFLGQPQMAGGCLVMPSGQRMFSVQAQQFAYSNRAFVTQQQQASPFTASASAQPFFSPSPVANGPQFVMVQGFPTSHPGAAIAMIPQQPAEPPSSPQFNASSTVAATDTTDNCEISEVNSGDFMSMANGNNDYSRDDGMSANDARTSTLDTKWYYIGQDCKTYGPNSASVMAEWYRARYFPENVLLRTENDESFYKLSEWISNCGNQIPFTKNIISMNALTGEGSMNGFAPPGLSVNGGLHGGQNSLSPNSESPMGISSQERFLGQPQMADGCLVMPSGQRMFSVQAQPFAYSNRAFVTQQQQASPFTASSVANGPQFVMVQGFPTSHPGASITMIPQQSTAALSPAFLINPKMR